MSSYVILLTTGNDARSASGERMQIPQQGGRANRAIISTPMHRRRVALTVALLGILTASSFSQQPDASRERDFLSRVRRLTVEGRRAGEGYWSLDGRRIVFQS